MPRPVSREPKARKPLRVAVVGADSRKWVETWADPLASRGILVFSWDRPRVDLIKHLKMAFRGLNHEGSMEASGPAVPPDLVHALDLGASDTAHELANRSHSPVLLSVSEFLNPGQRLRLRKGLCQQVIVPNIDLKESLAQEHAVPARMIQVVPVGESVPSPVRTTEGAFTPVVGTVIRTSHGSGLPFFLGSAAELISQGIDVEFVLAISRESSAMARRLARALGVGERLTVVGIDELDQHFWPVVDLYVEPAVHSTTGIYVQAALAQALPAIVTNVPGLRCLASQTESLTCVEPGEVSALARAILSLIHDPSQRRLLGECGQAWVSQTLDPHSFCERLASLYRRASRPQISITRMRTLHSPRASLRS